MPPIEFARIARDESASKFRSALESNIVLSPGNIVIAAHFTPDYDSICSSLALQKILKNKYPGKKITVVVSDKQIAKWDRVDTNRDIVWVHEKPTEHDFLDHCQPEDTLICIDAPRAGMFVRDKNVQAELAQRPNTFLIDHHPNTEMHQNTSYVRETAASCSELIARLFDIDEIDPVAAGLLYIGLYEDSGGFEYIKNEQEDIFSLAQNLLIRSGARSSELLEKIALTQKEALLVQELIVNEGRSSDKTSINFKYSRLTEHVTDEQATNTARQALRYYLEKYALRIDGVDLVWAIYPLEQPNSYKLSFRSKLCLDVNALCQKHFNGGGHINSAGGILTLDDASQDPNKVIKKVVEEFFLR